MGSSNTPDGKVSTQVNECINSPYPSGLTEKLDAGLKSLDHCRVLGPYLGAKADLETDKNKLPQWRYLPRQKLIPLIRWETPYLAVIQSRMRSPALDSYFSVTANLGTHTFFMIVLPILFWCGYTSLGRG